MQKYEKLTKKELSLILKATKKELTKTKKELTIVKKECDLMYDEFLKMREDLDNTKKALDDYKARTVFWYKKANRALFKLNYNTKCLKMFNDLCEKYTNTYKKWAYFEEA